MKGRRGMDTIILFPSQYFELDEPETVYSAETSFRMGK